MLSIRMIVFAGIAGICLWGLFTLLDNLKEPALLRTAQGIAVKGCSTLDAHADAPKRCPGFLCQKALVDRRLMTLEDRVEITLESTQGADRIIAGTLVGKGQPFECVVRDVTVTKALLVEPAPAASDPTA